MDKRIVFAAAGSGKTSYIIGNVQDSGRCLILTYTSKNFDNIQGRLIQEYGRIPEGTAVFTYFSFLYKFCYKPILFSRYAAEGMNFTRELPRYVGSDTKARYVDSNNQLYAGRMARLFLQEEIISDVVARIEKYFDMILVDEVQDFGGHDFNLLLDMVQAERDVLLVGDYHQHTYDTSRDGTVNSGLHDDFEAYQQRFVEAELTLDRNTLVKSYRCSPTVCTFIQDNLDIQIESHRNDETQIHLVESAQEAQRLFDDNRVVKLFYQSSARYPCHSRNWGESKGEDQHENICVVLNPNTYRKYQSNTLATLAPGTKNKLYVALSRARGNIFLVPQSAYNDFKD